MADENQAPSNEPKESPLAPKARAWVDAQNELQAARNKAAIAEKALTDAVGPRGRRAIPLTVSGSPVIVTVNPGGTPKVSAAPLDS